MNFIELKESYSPFLLIGSTLIIVLLIASKENKQKEIIKDFTNPLFLALCVGITLFSIWIFNQKKKTPEIPEIPEIKKLKEATRKALSALIIAYLAHLDMIFAPFFVVFILDYFLSGWV